MVGVVTETKGAGLHCSNSPKNWAWGPGLMQRACVGGWVGRLEPVP